MKKILLLFAAVGMFSLSSCSSDDDNVDNDTISEVFQVNVNFLAPSYSIVQPLNPVIYSSDVVLVYRQIGLSGNKPIWQSVPHTLYLDEGELDYVFDFTESDINIYLQSTYDLALTPELTQNQTFRIVIVPGYFSSTVNVNDYDAVMNALSQERGGLPEIQVIE